MIVSFDTLFNTFSIDDNLVFFFIVQGETYRSYMEVLLGNGIFNVDGELWRKQRKTASFEFASKNLRDFSTIVFREYSQKLHGILSRASFQGQAIDMQV